MQQHIKRARTPMQGANLPPSFRREVYSLVDDKIDDISMFVGTYCESPIEVAFATAFLILGEFNYGQVALHGPANSGPVNPMEFEHVLKCQHQIGRYHVDFLTYWTYPEYTKKIVFECDGHDFHERTKEQAKRDRQRDRSLQSDGYRVMRFTGSEIHQDAFQCATEVFEALLGIADEASIRL